MEEPIHFLVEDRPGTLLQVALVPGVSNCYVFKSRLQEYAQKAGILSPVYETTKEGPSHEPCFRSTVIVKNVRYDSLPGFFNRKAAEQSAAEIALMELAKSANMNECIAHPVHETGLCKNLLQEYAQKLNYAIPSYVCHKDETPGKMPFSCTVDIGGIHYIGAAARTKKEAEIKAARTALVAIQSNVGGPEWKPNGSSQFTVVPGKKKGPESGNAQDETAKSLKTKKAHFKRKWPKKKLPRNNGNEISFNQTKQATGNMEIVSQVQVENMGMLEASKDSRAVQLVGSELDQNDTSGIQVEDSGRTVMEANLNFQNTLQGKSNFNRNEGEISVTKGANTNENSQDGKPMGLNFNQNEQRRSSMEILCGVQIKDLATLVMEVNKVCGVGQVAAMGTNASMSESEASGVMVEHPLSKDNLEGPIQIEDRNRDLKCEIKQE
ncbi:hypothetical protein HHK36_030767 [Tetracentron sinense]|uniref:DRBM domain-containing protein n=1 Tax=Tetracentron sinense TaxID=13715 RepID=A0A834YBN8_TETSI|nr:hypothetical protein HHK36_030767 [Tetracentron sinense]